MKTKLAIIVAAIALLPLAIIAQSAVGIGQWVVVNTDAAVPVTLTNVVTKAIRCTLIGRKANRTANTGTVYVGMLSANDSQPIEITAGAVVSVLIPDGRALDLSKIYLDVVTVGDGVLVLYE